ncbi:unnamed protein product, partial [Pylaiella littoralis]
RKINAWRGINPPPPPPTARYARERLVSAGEQNKLRVAEDFSGSTLVLCCVSETTIFCSKTGLQFRRRSYRRCFSVLLAVFPIYLCFGGCLPLHVGINID